MAPPVRGRPVVGAPVTAPGVRDRRNTEQLVERSGWATAATAAVLVALVAGPWAILAVFLWWQW